MRCVFIAGTDTDVGKTFVSSLLVKAWNSNYWKPIQTGTESDQGDTERVKNLTDLPEKFFQPPQIELQKPLSPWNASMLENSSIDLHQIRVPDCFISSDKPLIIEGAGGLFVPINKTSIMTDLIYHLDVPVILVAKSGLGTINHTLLSIEHLKRRNIRILGIVLNGKPNPENAAAIEHFAENVPVIFQTPDINIEKTLIDSLIELVPKLETL